MIRKYVGKNDNKNNLITLILNFFLKKHIFKLWIEQLHNLIRGIYIHSL